MAGNPHNRRERLGAAALAVLLALSVVAGTTGVGTAHGDVDHVERNGNQLVIDLGDQHNVTNATSITVVSENGNSTVETVEDATDTFQVPVTNLSDPQTDLRNANVTVRVGGTDLFTETVDLRYLRFVDTGSDQVSFSGSDLRIPLSDALGYGPGASVSTTFGGNEVTGTIQYDGGQPYLAVSLTAERVVGAPSDPVTLRADGQSTTVQLQTAVRDATGVDFLDDETLLVTNPLLSAGSSYDVVARTTNPNGTYANATAANASGGLTVANRLFASAKSVAVSVYADGSPLVENVTGSAGSGSVLTANVTENGSAVELADSSLDANATVWLTNATDGGDDGTYVNASVPVEDGTVNLSSTDYRLNRNASYRLIVAADPAVRATVPGNSSANDSAVDSLFYAGAGDGSGGDGSGGDGSGGDGESSGGVFGVGSGLLVAGAALFGFVLIGVFGFFRLSGDDGGSTPDPDEVDSAAVASAHDSGDAVDFRVEDAATGSTVSAGLQARQKADNAAYRTGGPSSEEADLSNGTGSVTLDRGTWVVEVGGHGVSEQRELSMPVRGQPVEFTLGPKQVDVTVADGGDPLSGVPVTCTPDQGRARDGRTGDDGEVTFDVPLAADEVEVSADPDRYDGDTASASVAGGSDASVSLDVQPETGDLEVTATVEGTPVGGLPVEVEPRDEGVKELGAGARTATTGDDGVARFEDLLVGEYAVAASVPGGGSAFSVEPTSARVTDGRTARASVDADFEFSLGRNQRDRIDSVKREVDEMVSISGRDVAIQRYFGRVVKDLLETVRRLSGQGHRFASVEADPNEVADALLDAAEASADLVGDAMTTKRNTDLFGACVDMPDHRVEWSEGYDQETLFELLEADRKDQRQTVLTQLRAVDDRITDERSDLAEVSPARELWDGVKAFVNEERGDDRVRGAAVAFAAGGLLDAVDELFDHEQLRERLQRTVF